MALISLAPFGIGSGFIALILFRRDLHTVFNESLLKPRKTLNFVSTVADYLLFGHNMFGSTELLLETCHLRGATLKAVRCLRGVRNAFVTCSIRVVFRNLHHLFCTYSVIKSIRTLCTFINELPSISRLHHMNNNTIIENLSKFLIISSSVLMALLVCISRIYLQYHTISQVVCGGLVGVLFATFWFALTYLVFTPLFPQIVSW